MTSEEMPDAWKSRRHKWIDGEEKRIPGCEAPDGNDRTEKTCPNCGLVKITIHYPHSLPGRRWRAHGSTEEIDVGSTPPCLPGEVPFA